MAEFQGTSLTVLDLLSNLFRLRQLHFNITFNILNNNVAAQEQLRSNSLHVILAFIVPVILNFIEVKYQGSNKTPFQTHPRTTMVAIVSLLTYCVAYGVELRFSSQLSPRGACISQGVTALFNSLSLASLASILFPDMVHPALYVFYTLLLVGEIYGPDRVQRLYHWIRGVIDKLFSVLYEQQGHTSPLLPLTYMDTNLVLST